MRGRFVHGLATVAAALALLPTGVAVAQTTNPFAPGLPSSQPTVPTQSTPTVTPLQTTTTSGSSSLSGTGALLIGVGALVVLAGIGFFIWYDARKRAPVRHRSATAGPATGLPGSGKTASKARAKPRKLSPAERRRRKRGRAR